MQIRGAQKEESISMKRLFCYLLVNYFISLAAFTILLVPIREAPASIMTFRIDMDHDVLDIGKLLLHLSVHILSNVMRSNQ